MTPKRRLHSIIVRNGCTRIMYFIESDDQELQNQLQGIREPLVEREVTHSLPERRILADIMGDMDEDLPEEDIVRRKVEAPLMPWLPMPSYASRFSVSSQSLKPNLRHCLTSSCPIHAGRAHCAES